MIRALLVVLAVGAVPSLSFADVGPMKAAARYAYQPPGATDVRTTSARPLWQKPVQSVAVTSSRPSAPATAAVSRRDPAVKPVLWRSP